MRPVRFRNRRGFAAIQAAPLALFSAAPALSAPFVSAQITDAAPVAIALGALGFGLLASYLVRRAHRQNAEVTERAYQQMAEMRAELDLTTGILDGLSELTIMWRDNNTAPSVYGQAELLLPGGSDAGSVTDFRNWLTPTDGAQLTGLVTRLKTAAKSFDVSLVSLDGRLTRISGRVLGGAAVMRVRLATDQPEAPLKTLNEHILADALSAETIFDLFERPAWIRNSDGILNYANAAYWALVDRMNIQNKSGEIPELFNVDQVNVQIDTLKDLTGPFNSENVLEAHGAYDMVLFRLDERTAGFLREREPDIEIAESGAAEFESSAGIIDAIATPIAIFDKKRRLRHFNKAYSAFWDLDPEWLKTGVSEPAILDRLRTQSQLPSEVDYRAWRSKHLGAYTLKESREEPWYLPDGRALNVIAVPAASGGGVIYIFEEITEQLALESRYNGLIHVQSETLSALSEGVAVFGTNGRLTLHNPRLSMLWKLPMKELGQHPHIDQVAEACAKAMPEDGGTIWRDLKRGIIDLNPTRTDTSGRLTRADGRLIDYAIVRLPDGQTMMTFVDVTESASYQRILRERNDALVTADRLKDAFVQNVSYELRSPLTSIIGFADLLASGSAGDLNEKQRSYTNYIRASSETLGVLIDNILDLATIDAGVAELRLEPQDIAKLVERARAGLASTMSAGGGGEAPALIIDIADNLPSFIADGTRIVQVLYNLLSNATRYSAPGAEVRLSVTSQAGRIVFTVEDEGMGIPDEMKAVMHQQFEKPQLEGRQHSAGMGLAIVKTFVNLHGGTVSLERREPKGTRVIVSIPANPAQAVSAAE